MNRSVLFSLVGFLGFATLGGFYLAQPNPLTGRVKQLESELSEEKKENTRLKGEFEKLQAAKKAAEVLLAQSNKNNAAASARSAQPVTAQAVSKDGKTNSADAARAADPAAKERVREMMLKMQEGQVDINYGKLIKHLGLNAEEEERFKQLIRDRQTKQSDISMKLSDRTLSAEQKKAITAEMTAARNASDAEIKHFLDSEEDYQTYKEWEGTLGERLQVQMAVTSFDAADASLSTEQREQLLNLLVTERKANSQKANVKAPAGSQVNAIALMREREQAMNQSVLKQAASFLTPEQLAVFEKAQQRRLDMFYRVPTAPVK
jgi:hypothetical protein